MVHGYLYYDPSLILGVCESNQKSKWQELTFYKQVNPIKQL